MKMQTPATPADTVPDPADLAIAQAEAWQCRRRRWWIVGGVIWLIASNPLSVGPLTFLDQKGLIPSVLYPITQAAYFPILYLVTNVPVVEHIYKSYLWSLGIDL